MRAGPLRHRIAVQRQELTQDENTGAMVVRWVDACRPWARVEPLSARDLIAAQANHSRVTARIVIRYRDDIDATMRIMYRGKTYTIEGVLPDMKSGLEYLTLPVAEGGTRDD